MQGHATLALRVAGLATSGNSPNQVLTHAARAAAKQPLVAALGALEGLWLEQSGNVRRFTRPVVKPARLHFACLVPLIGEATKEARGAQQHFELAMPAPLRDAACPNF